MKDLFGQLVNEETLPLPKGSKPKRNETPRGYAAPPGTGPKDHFCRDCRNAVARHYSKVYWKCALMVTKWTGGFKTDIRLKSPACRHWTPKCQKDPDGRNIYVANKSEDLQGVQFHSRG